MVQNQNLHLLKTTKKVITENNEKNMGTKGYKAKPITAKAKDSSRGCSPAPFKQTKEKSFANKAGHLALDVLGFVDLYGIGTAADLINAGWYAGEGDKTNAALSTAAAIPFGGWAAGATKLGLKGTKTIKAAKKGDKAVEAYKNSKLINNKLSRGLQLNKPFKIGTTERIANTVLDETGVTDYVNNVDKVDSKERTKKEVSASDNNLNGLIKARKNMEKGSDEYNANQNKINALLGNKKIY